MLFKDVMIDESLKKQLIVLVKENRISHAQLFLSQQGTDAFALAIAYSQYICCENRGEEDSCGVCPSCIQFSKLAHPDLHLVFPNCITKNIKKDPDSNLFAADFRNFVFNKKWHIDLNDWLLELGGENKQASINIRDCSNIINQNSIRSYAGGYKIYILWMVERLYHAAAPKLLKTLEEPENQSLFILITENQDKLLSTIISRTQLVKIPPLSPQLIQNQLIKEYSVDNKFAADIADISEGNYIKAMNIFLDSGELKTMLSLFELMFSSMVALAKHAPNSQIRFLEMQTAIGDLISKGRESQKNFLFFFIRMIRNILLVNSQHEQIVKATSDEKRLLQFFQSFITLKNVTPILDECNKALYYLERNGNSALIFTDLYLKISAQLNV